MVAIDWLRSLRALPTSQRPIRRSRRSGFKASEPLEQQVMLSATSPHDPNEPTVATDDYYGYDSDEIRPGKTFHSRYTEGGGVMQNDNVEDWSKTSIRIVSGPSHGEIDNSISGGGCVYEPTGGFGYRPDSTFAGEDSFVYELLYHVDDETTISLGQATAYFNVSNEGPIAEDDNFVIKAGKSFKGKVLVYCLAFRRSFLVGAGFKDRRNLL